MISYYEFARQILLGDTLYDKLLDVPFEWIPWVHFELPPVPGRKGKINISREKLKFPKRQALYEKEKRAMALHSFANHELLAIEMMAAALLVYPHEDENGIRFKKGILQALKDEQKHLRLYIGRLNSLGHDFGDFPLNDYFWRQMLKLKTPSQYLAVMSLTFEAANLDFAQYYGRVFEELGDIESANILQIVLEDEVAHVALGSHWMKRWRKDKSLWQYYLDCLPRPMTPARGKGHALDVGLHARAMNDEDFVFQLEQYQDDFMITKRK